MKHFPNLFSVASLGKAKLKNRVIFGPHGTTLGHDGKVTDELIAYHEARARGGAALTILESATVHHTYAYPKQFILFESYVDLFYFFEANKNSATGSLFQVSPKSRIHFCI